MPRLASIILFALASLGCDTPNPASPESCRPEFVVGPNPQITPVEDIEGIGPPPASDLYPDMAQQVPSFAGFYNDGGWLKVLVADPADAEAMIETVSAYEGGGLLEGRAGVRIGVVKYSWLQLAHWEHAAVINLVNLGFGGGDGFLGNGINDKENRIKIKMEQGTCVSVLSQLLQEAGIPGDAIQVVEGYPATG